jgi:hypothetical protein
MPRCKGCNKFTDFSKGSVRIKDNNGFVKWLCIKCQPVIKIKDTRKGTMVAK